MAAANGARHAPLRPLWQPQDGSPAVLVSEALATTQEAVVTHRFTVAVDILRKARKEGRKDRPPEEVGASGFP